MAVLDDLTKVNVALKLNNGTKDGNVQTVDVSLGTLNINTYDNQKAMNIINLLKPCLDKDVYKVQKVATSTLSNDD